MDEKGGLYAGGKTAVKNTTGKGKSKSKSKKTALVFVVLVVAFIVIFIGMSGLPSLMIGAIDYNLQDALGFTDTTAILENQAEYVTAEMLALGEVPSGYAGDLAAHNLAVGQVTARGDFVRTDVYLAELDSPEYDGDANIVAAAGEFYRNGNPGKGELAVLFGDQLVSAGEFVAVVESSPEMYAAYAEAADISARYYYGEDVNAAYQDLGVVRGAFNSWTATGDAEKDAESFKETLAQVLDSGSTVTMNGYGKIVYKTTCYNEDTHATYECEEEKELKFSKNASGDGIISGLANESIGSNATEKAVELLNGAVSSSEPYLAANAFMAIEEPIQRARINGDGPVNELMNTISRGTVEEVKDAEGNVTETINHKSILETKNFVAAVSGGNYSVAEAAEFSRDRVLKSTGQIESDTQQSTMKGIINSTVINTDGKQKSSLGVKIQSNENKPDANTLEKAKDDIELGLVEKNSSTFQSEVGGNRIVEGGAFISSFLNQRAIGAMPSDEAAVLAYQERVDEVLARRAAAERATKSPLDASSRYTWLGSILHNFATTMLRHAGESGPEQFFGVVGDLITGAVSSDAAAAGEGA
ncbi:hypothetical protein IJ135_01285, partial [Candidatus Saccharibacteria bacterium]|nr:hypothetical protein [Candidatus Saccharibacteria bacterium]